MIGLLLIGALVAAAVLTALGLRLSSLVSTVLAAYLVLVGNVGLATWALSPLRGVTRTGLGVAEAVMLVAAFAFWWLRGRPGLPLASARIGGRLVLTDPVTAVFLAFVLLLLAYELLLGVTVAPTNGDALAYHLAKAAAWAQHGGLYWIPNAPSVRMNVFQPLAEQQLLFLLVATRSGALIALPQFFAELAILVAVFGAARRLGFEVRAATCGALLVATFSLVALEATTAQNDLVAASFPAVALCLLLGAGRLDPVLGGVAVGFGIGTKLDTALVLPILGWVVLTRGRRTVGWATVGVAIGMVTVGMWSFVLNLIASGHVLGLGSGGEENRTSPSYPASVATGFRLVYASMDLSVLSDRLIYLLAAAGALAAAGIAFWALRRSRPGEAARSAAEVATPLLAPLLVFCASGLVAFGAARWGFPIRGPQGITQYVDSDLNETWTRISNENYSFLGPIGIASLIVAAALTVYAYVRRQTDARQLALATALPLFLILLALGAVWSVWIVRFLFLPVVLTAPLLARLFRTRVASAAYFAVAALTVSLTIAHDQSKPLVSPYGYGPPWQLTTEHAFQTFSRSDYAGALVAYDNVVPPRACVGAILGGNEPAYLLYGPHLQHHVDYLSVNGDPADAAVQDGLFYVVISTGDDSVAAGVFKGAGWKIRPLGTYWLLATYPGAGGGNCSV